MVASYPVSVVSLIHMAPQAFVNRFNAIGEERKGKTFGRVVNEPSNISKSSRTEFVIDAYHLAIRLLIKIYERYAEVPHYR